MRVALITVMMLASGAAARADEPSSELRPRQQNTVVRHVAEDEAPVWGPRQAPVTAELFFSLRNPTTSRRAFERLMELSRNHPHRLRIVFRIADPASSYIGEAAIEAHQQGRFFEFVTAFFRGRSMPLRNGLAPLAEAARVDLARIEAALSHHLHAPTLERNLERMQRMSLRHSPTTVLFNGKEPLRQITNISTDDLEQAYDEAYARAQRLLQRGATLATLPERAALELAVARKPPVLDAGDVDGLRRRARPRERATRLIGGDAASTGRHGRGAERPRTVIVLYCSFQSRNCGRTAEAIARARDAHGDEIYVYFNHFFDKRDSNQFSVELAHQAALCAEDQAAFWEFYDYQYNMVQSRQVRHITTDELREAAAVLAIDEKRFVSCVESGRKQAEVDRLVAQARAAGVRRTPSVVIGGRLYEGSLTRRQVMAIIAEERRPGLLEQLVPEVGVAPTGDR